MERLTAEDLMMIWPEKLGWSQDVGALVLLDGRALFDADHRFRIATARGVIGRRLHLVPRFRQLLWRPSLGCGWPLWVDAPAFDLTEHVRVRALDAPGDEATLLRACEECRSRRLSGSRPLWEMTFLTGLPDGVVGLFIKVHHAVVDGTTGMAALSGFFDAVPELPREPIRPWSPVTAPTPRELLADNVRSRLRGLGAVASTLAHPRACVDQIRDGWPALREACFEARAPSTSLNHQPVGWHRRFALIRGSLDDAKRVARQHDATVNDVLMTILAAGLRELLIGRGEHVDDVVLRAAVPVSLHGQHAGAQGNRDGMMTVPLPIGVPDDLRRLECITAETAVRKQKHYMPGGVLFRNGLLQRAFLRVMARQRFMNTYAANVPGPPMPLFFAGSRVLDIFPIVPLQGNIAIGVGALSYAGRFNITVVADRDLVPDLEVFVDGARRSSHALAQGAALVETARGRR
jgi:WS/DGAT/MGAT family acyltransferase